MYNESPLVACQNGMLTSMKPKQNVPTLKKKQLCWRGLAHGMQARLSTWGHARHSMEKATCRCGVPEAMVFLGQSPPCIPRSLAATIEWVYSPCAHIQHGYVGTNANGMGQVGCIPPSSAKTGHRHQMLSANLEQHPLLKMCIQPTEPVCHQSSVEPVWTCASHAT